MAKVFFCCTMNTFLYLMTLEFTVFLHGNTEVEQSISGSESRIVKEILIDLLVEYIFNDKTFIAFIVTRQQEMRFQRDLLDAVFSDTALTASTYSILNKLHDGTRTRKNIFNVIFVEDCESLA